MINDAALNALELRQTDRQRVLDDWEKERSAARPVQCLNALDKLKKSIESFKEQWYNANFLSAYDVKVAMQALQNACDGDRDRVARHIERATGEVKIDPTIKEFMEELGAAASEEQSELEAAGKSKKGKQMTLFDELADQGVTTILELQSFDTEPQLRRAK